MIDTNEILSSGIFDFDVFPLSENLEKRGIGENKKQTLVCFTETTNPNSKSFLEKVMSSVGVNLETDAFSIPIKDKELFRFSAIDHDAGFKTVLFFGIHPDQAGLNLNAQKYHPLSFAGYTILFSDDLETIQQKPALKRPLWEALKKINW